MWCAVQVPVLLLYRTPPPKGPCLEALMAGADWFPKSTYPTSELTILYAAGTGMGNH